MALVGRSGELLFPGLIALIFGAIGARAGWSARGRSREIAVLYVSLAVLAVWASFGPDGGLYRLLYAAVPGFTFMRAPSRFGLLVVFSCSVLAGMGIAAFRSRRSKGMLTGSVLAFAAVVELIVPLRLTPAPPVEPVYQALSGLPDGAVLELPVYSHPFRFLRARYMLASTVHWKPLVVAYSDHIPADFAENVNVLADFPSRTAFKKLERDRVRYVVFHLNSYSAGDAREALKARLEEFAPYLRRLHADEGALLYEIVGFPP
jgi:hypothetical protein